MAIPLSSTISLSNNNTQHCQHILAAATLSNAVYEDGGSHMEKLLQGPRGHGLTHVAFSSNFPRQRHIVAEDQSGDTVYYAFAGTDNLSDVVVDARFTPVLAFGGSVHKGFLERANLVALAPLVDAVKQGKQVVVTGHSLGGAVAILVVLRLFHEHFLIDSGAAVGLAAKSRTQIKCITFAAPSVGDDALFAFIQRNKLDPIFHFIANYEDYVPHMHGMAGKLKAVLVDQLRAFALRKGKGKKTTAPETGAEAGADAETVEAEKDADADADLDAGADKGPESGYRPATVVPTTDSASTSAGVPAYTTKPDPKPKSKSSAVLSGVSMLVSDHFEAKILDFHQFVGSVYVMFPPRAKGHAGTEAKAAEAEAEAEAEAKAEAEDAGRERFQFSEASPKFVEKWSSAMRGSNPSLDSLMQHRMVVYLSRVSAILKWLDPLEVEDGVPQPDPVSLALNPIIKSVRVQRTGAGLKLRLTGPNFGYCRGVLIGDMKRAPYTPDAVLIFRGKGKGGEGEGEGSDGEGTLGGRSGVTIAHNSEVSVLLSERSAAAAAALRSGTVIVIQSPFGQHAKVLDSASIESFTVLSELASLVADLSMLSLYEKAFARCLVFAERDPESGGLARLILDTMTEMKAALVPEESPSFVTLYALYLKDRNRDLLKIMRMAKPVIKHMCDQFADKGVVSDFKKLLEWKDQKAYIGGVPYKEYLQGELSREKVPCDDLPAVEYYLERRYLATMQPPTEGGDTAIATAAVAAEPETAPKPPSKAKPSTLANAVALAASAAASVSSSAAASSASTAASTPPAVRSVGHIRFINNVHLLRNLLIAHPIIGVIGPSNSGKSTLVQSVFGFNTTAGLLNETEKVTTYHMERIASPYVCVADYPGVDRVRQHHTYATSLDTSHQMLLFAVVVVEAQHSVDQPSLELVESLRSIEVPFLLCLNKVDLLLHTITTRQEATALKEQASRVLGVPMSAIWFTAFEDQTQSVARSEAGAGHEGLRRTGAGASDLSMSFDVKGVADVAAWIKQQLFDTGIERADEIMGYRDGGD